MTGMIVTSASVSGSRLILAMLRLVSTRTSVAKCDTELRSYVTSRSETSSAVIAVMLPPSLPRRRWCLRPGQ
jgi:hypothetical protein